MTYLLQPGLSRRQFVTGLAAGGLLYNLGSRRARALPADPPVLRGRQFQLDIGYQAVNFTGHERTATAVNGSVPAPILRWREGDRVTLRVRNHLAEDSSIHWHGMILPSNMDGVPGLSFAGIRPGDSYEYQFDVGQHGTYWYHSHSGFQEQTGLYGAIVIDPKDADPYPCDRDYVVLLSDWTDDDPHDLYARLKKMSHYYNFRERTAGDLWRDLRAKGVRQTWDERAMWNVMRMSNTDIADVTGYTYTYLMNGAPPASGWQGLFQAGETVRLRFINGSAMSIFDVRIPGLEMRVIAADGQLIDPVTVDEFRIGTAETYDVIVKPADHSAYTVFAQSIDRSGYARGTLTPDPGLRAEVPPMDPAPTLGHGDMGMGHGGDHAGHDMAMAGGNNGGHAGHSMSMAKASGNGHAGHDMGSHGGHKGHQDRHQAPALAPAGSGSDAAIIHADTEYGPHVDMRATMPSSGLDDPGIGLRHHQHRHGRRVLTYRDLCNYYPTEDRRDPSREIQLHLTGNMARYMWSFDGVKFADAEPIRLKYGERVRFHLVNDTMMTHPIHLHGLWSELETEDPDYIPRKHTVLVQPGSSISYLVTADARGRWAYHCHLQYHMLGMMREVRVE